MKAKVYFYISLRVIIFCSCGFFTSWLFENHHEFFGDTFYPGQTQVKDGPYISNRDQRDHWDYSGRHIWFMICGVTLCIHQFIDACISIVKYVKKHYPNLSK